MRRLAWKLRIVVENSNHERTLGKRGRKREQSSYLWCLAGRTFSRGVWGMEEDWKEEKKKSFGFKWGGKVGLAPKKFCTVARTPPSVKKYLTAEILTT